MGHEQQRRKYLFSFAVTLMCSDTNQPTSARNLRALFDHNFNFRKHTRISQVCSSCLYHIRGLCPIGRHLSLDTTDPLASALVTSRPDDRNSVLQGVTGCNLERLQRSQNSLAHAVARSRPFAHFPPLLQILHYTFQSNLEETSN